MNVSQKQWLVALEIIIQAVVVCQCVCAVGLMCRWWYVQHVYPNDYILYYNAAVGVYDDFAGDVWSYKNWIAIIFTPFRWQPPFESYLYWCGVQTLASMLIVHKMFEVKWGWVLVLPVMHYFRVDGSNR